MKTGKIEEDFQLTEQQKLIVFHLSQEQKYFEELVTLTGIAPDILTGELVMLELDGVVESRAGRAYALLTK